MDKRYQVFISSTYSDLKDERKEIIEALLNAKYIPAGMEMFSASNDEQFKYIKKIIDNCDYYVLVIAGRYGTINPNTGISFTEQEYEYALSLNIPVLVFLHNDPFNLPEAKRDDEKREKLQSFISKASTNRMCKMWNTRSELISSVIISMNEIVDDIPQSGWVRGDVLDNKELLIQLNNLRIEKAKSEKEILHLNDIISKYKDSSNDVGSGSDIFCIKGEKGAIVNFIASDGSKIYDPFEYNMSWDEIFSLIGPHLFSNKLEEKFCFKLKEVINEYIKPLHFRSINNDCIQTIKIQFLVLGLIKIETLTEKGINEYIKLTEKGKSYLQKIKSVKKS